MAFSILSEPCADPMLITAVPALPITLLTSAKSRFIKLGIVIVSAMPLTALHAMLSY